MIALTAVISTHEMLNVIIISVHFDFFCSSLLITFTLLGHCTDNNFGVGLQEIVVE